MKVSFLILNYIFFFNFECLDKATLITGDLNLCLKKNPRNFVTKRLLGMGFTQLVTEATHIKGGWINNKF